MKYIEDNFQNLIIEIYSATMYNISFKHEILDCFFYWPTRSGRVQVSTMKRRETIFFLQISFLQWCNALICHFKHPDIQCTLMVLIQFGFKFCNTLPESRLKRKLKEGFTLKQNTKELLLPVTVYFTSNEFYLFYSWWSL